MSFRQLLPLCRDKVEVTHIIFYYGFIFFYLSKRVFFCLTHWFDMFDWDFFCLGISFLSNRFKLEGQDTLIGFLFDYLFPFSQTVVLFSTF
jgi:hypothetical protein